MQNAELRRLIRRKLKPLRMLMPEISAAKVSNVFPVLRYKEARCAIDWLTSAFGFEEQIVIANDDGTIAHAELKFGPGIVMLASAREDHFGTKTPTEANGVTQMIYITVDLVDDHHDRAKAAGAEIVMELTDMDYGSREYAARDLEGNVWSFGTYSPHNSQST
jgi:uncharacterized glyoxalase superfamily protein PhnB